MSGADLLTYLEELENADPTAPPPPIPDLLDRTNLDRFFLMEQFARYPHIPVFAEPVEHWPQSRLRDFTSIMLGRGQVQRMTALIDRAWNDPATQVDPPEWKGRP